MQIEFKVPSVAHEVYVLPVPPEDVARVDTLNEAGNLEEYVSENTDDWQWVSTQGNAHTSVDPEDCEVVE